MAFNNTVVGRAAASIWGLKLGNATMNAVLTQINATPGGVNDVVNQAFNNSYASYGNADIAAAFVNNLGLTGQARTDGIAYTVAQLDGVASTARGAKLLEIANQFAGITSDPLYGAFATEWNAKVAAAVAYSSQPGTIDAVLGNLPSANSFNMTVGQDNITATAGDDIVTGYIFDNQNTLQSGDFADGGAGTDLLYADMGDSQFFAVTPITRNIESIAIRAQSSAFDSGDNNIAYEYRVLVDAERIDGESRYESNNSRADLIFEDVRIADSQITKDITIAMVQTDPGNVDYGVYFDQHSLRASSSTSGELVLQIMDQFAVANGDDPLLNSPYDGIRFRYNGKDIQIRDDSINDALTYEELAEAIEVQLALEPLAAGVQVVIDGSEFETFDSFGRAVKGLNIKLQAAGTFEVVPGVSGWIASDPVPPDSSLFTNMETGSDSSEDLVTSKIILDDVGRGSNGGALVVGGLSVGETSNSKGVERFEITVERTSRLTNIDSTNNTLMEVTIVNGLVNGNLSVMGSVADDADLPGATKDEYGFNDVRLIDGSKLNGSLSFTASVSPDAFGKYIETADTDPDPTDDNGSLDGKTTQFADFDYSGGKGNDNMSIVVDDGIVASNSHVQAGREDFSFEVDGNDGNDSISFRVVPGAVADGNWYVAQHMLKNVTINGDVGNDTVRTPGAGDTKINLGTGADTAYADNSGGDAYAMGDGAITNVNSASGLENAMWTFNTVDQLNDGTPAARDRNDMLTDTNDSYDDNDGSLFGANVTVTFLGLSSSVRLPVSTAYAQPTDLHVNQAIKKAINDHAVLSKLLVAEDGPGFSLVVKSLIDGARVEGDLSVALTALDAASTTLLPETTFRELRETLPGLDANSTRVDLQALLDAGITNFDTRGDYTSRLANDGIFEMTGAASVTPSDNRIDPGLDTDIDVMVLGTTAGADELSSSNDTVVVKAGGSTAAKDVIVNFQAGAAATGGDKLVLSTLGGKAAGLDVDAAGGPTTADGATPAAGTIYVRKEDADTNEKDEIEDLFVADAANAKATTWLYVAVDQADADNGQADIWQLTDAAGTGGVTATFVGVVDLADTSWFDLTGDNIG